MIDLSGKVAFVTGGGSGIGDAVARQFIELGAKVGVAGRRTLVLEKLADQVGAIPLTCDVSDAAAVDVAITQLVKQLGRVDIVVNSAGVAHRGNAEDISLQDWQHVLDVNLTGALNVCKRAIPEMKKRGGGAIVNVSSVGGITAADASVGSRMLPSAGREELDGPRKGTSTTLEGSGFQEDSRHPWSLVNNYMISGSSQDHAE